MQRAASVALICGVFALCPLWAGVSPGLSAYSGNGQITFEYQLTPAPLVVRATDSNGAPLAGQPVFWSMAGGQGNLVAPVAKTDSNGFAMTDFMATAVPASASFVVQTVNATSPAGTASFTITTLATGVTLVTELLVPPPGSGLTGASGDILPGALKAAVSIAGGPQDGAPLSGVSVRLADANNPEAPPAAVCANAQSGEILTDATGTATCDVKLAGAPDSYSLAVVTGEQPAAVDLTATISPPATCTYFLSPGAASYGAGGGSGDFYLSTSPSCPWDAFSNGDWLEITSNAGGLGPAWISYTAAVNSGPPRTAAITIAGQTFTVSQDTAGGSAPLAITTPAPLPDGSTQQRYSTTLTAAGGTPPYTWSAQGALPAGLTLNAATGSIAGGPLIAGTTTFQLTVTDSAGSTASATFSITVEGFSGGLPGSYPTLKNAAIPAGAVAVPYLQTLNPVGGCTGPLSPDPSFAVSAGALPEGLTIREISPRLYALTGVPASAGTFAFTLAITDACGRAGHTNLSIAVSPAAVVAGPISASPISAQFTVQQYDTSSPPDQSIALASSTPTSYFVSLAPGSGGNWLSVGGTVTGAAPANITLHVANYSTLDPGTYTAAVVINRSGAGAPLIVPVTLTVTPSVAITLSPATVTLTVAATGGSAKTASQTITVQAAQKLSYSITASAQAAAWLSISKTSGTTDDTFDIVANAGSLPPGTYTGAVTVTPTSAAGPPRTIAVTLLITTSAEVSPSPGTVIVVYRAGDPMPSAQSISLGTLGGSAAAFSIAADEPWVTITPNAGSAPEAISVAIDPTTLGAGAHYASIVISTPGAASGHMSIPVTVFVPALKPSIESVQNAASYASGPVAPGEAVVIFGSSLGPAFLVSGSVVDGLQSTDIGGVEVTFNGTPAPILYARNDVISAMVPFGVAAGSTVSLQVSVTGLQSDPVSLSTAAAAPGIFTSGAGQAIALNADGSLNGPGHGASPGDVIGVYITGGGVTSPPSMDGQIAADTSHLLPRVTAQVNGTNATVVYAGNAPGLVEGVSLIRIQLPSNLPANTVVSIAISIGAVTTQPGMTIYVGP